MALASTAALANADLAKKNNCLSCHAVDKKIVGPAYQDVAKNMRVKPMQKPPSPNTSRLAAAANGGPFLCPHKRNSAMPMPKPLRFGY